MTIEEMFQSCAEKYGDEFHWHLLPSPDTGFVSQLRRELGSAHPLSGRNIQAVAKCDARDDVLFFVDGGGAEGGYYIFHLAYAPYSGDRFPRHIHFPELRAAAEFIEQDFIQEYL